jgi:broad specificity phosphatase PhoE
MKLYLARHGRTNYNDLGFCNGDPSVDVHLTPAGIEQSKALADKLKDVQVDCIFISELRRTRQTADIVNKFHNLELMVEPRLNDHRSGFEGKHFEELDKAMRAASNKWTARFNDGESIEDVKKRVATFLDELRTKKYDSVLVVTSQWVIYAILATLQDLSYEEAWNLEVTQGDYLELEI